MMFYMRYIVRSHEIKKASPLVSYFIFVCENISDYEQLYEV